MILDRKEDESVWVLLQDVLAFLVLSGFGGFLCVCDHGDALDRDGDLIRSDEVFLVIGELGLCCLGLEWRLHLEVADGVRGLK